MSDEESPNKSYYAVIPANVRYDKHLPANAKLLYGEITALCNAKGYCWASTEYFQNLYGVSRASVQNWLKALENKGYIYREVFYKENTKEIDKRVITISEGRPSSKNLNNPSQEIYTPLSKNLNNPSQEIYTDNNTSNTTKNTTTNKKPSKSLLTERFNKLWKEYPNKKGKENALKAYQKAVKDGVTDGTILDGIQRYKKEIEIKHTEQQFIAHGSTWFNQRRWEDDYQTEPEQPQMPHYAKPTYSGKPLEKSWDNMDELPF